MSTLPRSVRFQDTELSIIDRDGTPWLTALQIATALDAKGATLRSLYRRHRDEFIDAMTTVIPLGRTRVRVFSPRGAHLIAMFARTPKAKAFRQWVLDVLESYADREPRPPGLPGYYRILTVIEPGEPPRHKVLDDDVAIVRTRDVERLRRDCRELERRLRVLWGEESTSRLEVPLAALTHPTRQA